MRCRPDLFVGELPFVNDQSGFVLSFEHLRDDLIKRDDFGFDARSKEVQREICGGESAGKQCASLVLTSFAVNGRGETIIGTVAFADAATASPSARICPGRRDRREMKSR